MCVVIKGSLCCCVHRDLCSLYRLDQEICAAVLMSLLPSIKSLGKTHHMPEEMRHVQGSLLQVVSGFWLEACFYSMSIWTGSSLHTLHILYNEPLKMKDQHGGRRPQSLNN